MKFVGSIMFFFYMFSLLELEQIIVQLPVRCTDKFFIIYLDNKNKDKIIKKILILNVYIYLIIRLMQKYYSIN